ANSSRPSTPAARCQPCQPDNSYPAVAKNRSAASPNTAAGTNLLSATVKQVNTIAVPLTSRNKPSAPLVEPGFDASRTRPTTSQVSARTDIAVAATPSRASKQKTAATIWATNANPASTSATVLPSASPTQPSCRPLTTKVAAANPKKPIAIGPPIGRRQIFTRSRSEPYAASSPRLLNPGRPMIRSPITAPERRRPGPRPGRGPSTPKIGE